MKLETMLSTQIGMCAGALVTYPLVAFRMNDKDSGGLVLAGAVIGALIGYTKGKINEARQESNIFQKGRIIL